MPMCGRRAVLPLDLDPIGCGGATSVVCHRRGTTASPVMGPPTAGDPSREHVSDPPCRAIMTRCHLIPTPDVIALRIRSGGLRSYVCIVSDDSSECRSCTRNDQCGCFGRGKGDFRQHAGVEVAGHGDGRVPQHLLDHLHLHARGESEGGGAVAQVVQPDRRSPAWAASSRKWSVTSAECSGDPSGLVNTSPRHLRNGSPPIRGRVASNAGFTLSRTAPTAPRAARTQSRAPARRHRQTPRTPPRHRRQMGRDRGQRLGPLRRVLQTSALNVQPTQVGRHHVIVPGFAPMRTRWRANRVTWLRRVRAPPGPREGLSPPRHNFNHRW